MHKNKTFGKQTGGYGEVREVFAVHTDGVTRISAPAGLSGHSL